MICDWIFWQAEDRGSEQASHIRSMFCECYGIIVCLHSRLLFSRVLSHTFQANKRCGPQVLWLLVKTFCLVFQHQPVCATVVHIPAQNRCRPFEHSTLLNIVLVIALWGNSTARPFRVIDQNWRKHEETWNSSTAAETGWFGQPMISSQPGFKNRNVWYMKRRLEKRKSRTHITIGMSDRNIYAGSAHNLEPTSYYALVGPDHDAILHRSQLRKLQITVRRTNHTSQTFTPRLYSSTFHVWS